MTNNKPEWDALVTALNVVKWYQERDTRIRTEVVKWRDEAKATADASPPFSPTSIGWGYATVSLNRVLALLDGDKRAEAAHHAMTGEHSDEGDI